MARETLPILEWTIETPGQSNQTIKEYKAPSQLEPETGDDIDKGNSVALMLYSTAELLSMGLTAVSIATGQLPAIAVWAGVGLISHHEVKKFEKLVTPPSPGHTRL